MFFSVLSYGSAELGYPYKNLETTDFPGGAKVKTLPSNAGAGIQYALRAKNPRHRTNDIVTDFKNGKKRKTNLEIKDISKSLTPWTSFWSRRPQPLGSHAS